ncbi:MAG TPA: hypothetical protein PKL16_12150 [Anaerolineae bacterium]|nr:hypothetical protein [Anaerolineae bacterium]
MTLSYRQREFLGRLLDLYHESKHAVHYTDLAQSLGVKPVTAYEMLRLLEEKGLAQSELARPSGQRSRSIVLFSPTQKAMALLARWGGDRLDEHEWDRAKADILEALEQGKSTDYQDLLNELLQRLPERKSPQLFAADMVTAIILLLHELRQTVPLLDIVVDLHQFNSPTWEWLYSLAGLGLALSLVGKVASWNAAALSTYSQRLYQHLEDLRSGDKRRLSDFAHEVLEVVGS